MSWSAWALHESAPPVTTTSECGPRVAAQVADGRDDRCTQGRIDSRTALERGQLDGDLLLVGGGQRHQQVGVLAGASELAGAKDTQAGGDGRAGRPHDLSQHAFGHAQAGDALRHFQHARRSIEHIFHIGRADLRRAPLTENQQGRRHASHHGARQQEQAASDSPGQPARTRGSSGSGHGCAG